MLRSSKLNLYLLVFLALLAGAILLINTLTKNPYITALNANEIDSIIIETKDQPAIKMKKSGKAWQIMDADKTLNANPEKINLLIKLSITESLNQFEAPNSELVKYELSPPKLTIYLNNQAIHFGGLDPINHLRYIQVNQTVHLIKDEFYRHLLANKDAFIEN